MSEEVLALHALRDAVLAEIKKVIVGQEEALEGMLIALLAEGHALLEGVPGTAKTMMVRSLAATLGLNFGRIQFTPDLMPSDVVGTHVFDLSQSRFHLRKGPIFTELLLADEINRAPAKTQSALLEAMQEHQVSIDGQAQMLDACFTVFATQNPIEHEGTYPLPEAQLDRFLVKIEVGYPSEQEEDEILARAQVGVAVSDPASLGVMRVVTREQLLALRPLAGNVRVEEGVRRYVRDLIRATRNSSMILLGAGPRAGIHLLVAARWAAALEGRLFVTPDDVQRMLPLVIAHRLRLAPEAELDGLDARRVLTMCNRAWWSHVESKRAVPPASKTQTPMEPLAAQADTHVLPPSAPPHVRLGGRAFVWLATGLLPALFAAPQDAVLGTLAIDGLLFCLFLFDALRLSSLARPRARFDRSAPLHVERKLASRLRVGVSTPWLLQVSNESNLVLRLKVRDALPDNLRREDSDIQPLVLKAREVRELQADLLPLARGTAQLARVAVRVETRLGLAALHLEAGEPQALRILPALGLDAQTQRARRDELGGMAQRLKRAPQGSDLESLREYVSQDPLRAIDWKATARRHRPVTRLYQPERSQTLWLLIDASRTMAQPVGERTTPHHTTPITKSRFDIAVEAALADAALHAGDQVGLVVYADTCLSLVPPGRGRRHAIRLVDALSEVQARPVHFAVRSLLTDMERHARKRSLIVMFSDLENEVHGAAICEHARMLTRRHLAVCVSLQDILVGRRASLTPVTPAQVFHKAAAIDLLSDRERLQRSLEKRGITVLEADVRGLAPKLLDHFLKVKLAARL